MLNKIRSVMSTAVIRPTVYMAFTRFLLSLCASLLVREFVPANGRDLASWAFGFFCLFFVALAWIAWLRLDGASLPKPMRKRWNIRKKPTRTYGDMIDHVDEELISFDDLEDDEKDVCCLIADMVCALIYLVLTLI